LVKEDVGLDRVVFRDWPAPAPGPDEILVRVQSAAERLPAKASARQKKLAANSFIGWQVAPNTLHRDPRNGQTAHRFAALAQVAPRQLSGLALGSY
jgi:hypothetical protein